MEVLDLFGCEWILICEYITYQLIYVSKELSATVEIISICTVNRWPLTAKGGWCQWETGFLIIFSF